MPFGCRIGQTVPMWNAPVNIEPVLVDVGSSSGSVGACLVWRLPEGSRAVSSSMLGGGIGPASWVINMTVDADYGRMDPREHLLEVVNRLGLDGAGVGMMTAVDVGSFRGAVVDGAAAWATVGVRLPVWAADAARRDLTSRLAPGTINLVAKVPARLSDGALVNAVATMTEAKVQALQDHGIDGTGTASDAVCVVCGGDGPLEEFGGPCSTWGARIALATYQVVSAGIVEQRR